MDSTEGFHLGDEFSECVKLGILHSPSGRLLTAEVFNNEINVSGTTLRRRQVWTIVVEQGRPDIVYLKNHLGRFLSADKDGKVSGASKIPGTDERFLLEFCPEATGEWAFRSEAYGFYLSGSDVQVTCFSRTPAWWAIRVLIHPQVHLRHQFRSRYLRFLSNVSEVRADLAYPWDAETLFWLEQPPMGIGTGAGRAATTAIGRVAVARLGRVALRTEDGLYLTADGNLVEQMDESALFAFELRPGTPRAFAFRDQNGAYLTTSGPGTVKVKSSTLSPGKEELFLIERAALQVGVLAHDNKFASVKHGVDISANQHELDETSVFQLEYVGGKGFNCNETIAACCSLPQSPAGDWEPASLTQSATNGMIPGIYCLVTGYWRLRARSGKLWRMAPSAVVQNNANDGDKESLFEILSLADESTIVKEGQVVLKSNSLKDVGESLSARKLGAISSSGRQVCEVEPPASTDVFSLVLVNRPSIAVLSILTGGFVSRGKQTLLDCSTMNYERFEVKVTENHTYQLLSMDKRSVVSIWTACADGYVHLKPSKKEESASNDAIVDPGTEFLLYFLGNGRCLIRAYGSGTPGFNLVKAEPKGEVKWETTSEVLVNHIWEI